MESFFHVRGVLVLISNEPCILTSSRFGVSITCREINTRMVTRELLPLFII